MLRIFKRVNYLTFASLFLIHMALMQAEDKFFIPKEDRMTLKDKTGVIRKPKVLLFNCHYGAGHKMATQGIQESLPDCHINVVNIYDNPLQSLDPVREFVPEWSNEQLYNKMAKKEHNRLLNLAGYLGPKALFLQRKKVERLLAAFICKENPDLIISCIPLVNPMLLTVAKQRDIPFLVVTTDIDISYFCYGFKPDEIVSCPNKFQITVPFAKSEWDPLFKEKVPKGVEKSLHYSFGYPTRHAFSEVFEESILQKLREEYRIGRDENVVLVMMGGNAAQAAKTYATLLLAMSDKEIESIVGLGNPRNKIRLLCLCGDISQDENLTLMKELNALNGSKDKSNSQVIIHACPGTPKIAELVSLPELCTVISKPGGSTVNEMIKKKVPMVYHVSKVPLDWERGNLKYGVGRGLGKSFEVDEKVGAKSRSELVAVLADTFTLHSQIKNSNVSMPDAHYDFTENLRKTVKEMLEI
jgi:UDP-N-acetylglucosamine:LPS N-acetylglucosamine transferase